MQQLNAVQHQSDGQHAGAAGCGKTCAVTVLAAELGLSVRHWDTPTPTLWNEYLQQVLPERHPIHDMI